MYGSMKGFLPGNGKKDIVMAEFDGSSSVKDTIESVGNSHSGIGWI